MSGTDVGRAVIVALDTEGGAAVRDVGSILPAPSAADHD